MFVSHLLATGEVKADHRTEADERREVEDEEDVLRHVEVRVKTSSPKDKDSSTGPASQLASHSHSRSQTQLLVLVQIKRPPGSSFKLPLQIPSQNASNDPDGEQSPHPRCSSRLAPRQR